jgi:hypothetical protein
MSEPMERVVPEPREDLELATDVARDVRSFLETVELVAMGRAGSQAISLLLLDVAQMCVAGAHLGARTDVILDSNVEPLLDPLPDLDKVRDGLVQQLEAIDAYMEVFDPYDDEPPVRWRRTWPGLENSWALTRPGDGRSPWRSTTVGREGASMRILVVDDDESIRGLVRDVLEAEGYEVDVAADGFAALRRLAACRPDAVVLDVMMPGMDGYAVLSQIRSSEVDTTCRWSC